MNCLGEVHGLLTITPYFMQGYIRYRTSGCVEKVVESEKIPNVTFHAVGGKHILMAGWS